MLLHQVKQRILFSFFQALLNHQISMQLDVRTYEKLFEIEVCILNQRKNRLARQSSYRVLYLYRAEVVAVLPRTRSSGLLQFFSVERLLLSLGLFVNGNEVGHHHAHRVYKIEELLVWVPFRYCRWFEYLV